MNEELETKLKKMNKEELIAYRNAAKKGERMADIIGVILFLLVMLMTNFLFTVLSAPLVAILAIVGTGLRDTWKYIDKDLLKNDNG